MNAAGRCRLAAAVAILLAAIGVAEVRAQAESDARIELGLRTVSDLPGLVVTLLDRLPAPPKAERVPDFCERYAATPVSEAAREVKARGWTVTGEARLGALTGVSFAGRFEPATSGTCIVQDGNVGLFQGSRLVAVAYARRGSDTSIGSVSALEGGALRVWSGDPPGLPIADLTLDDARLVRIGPLAARETRCRGRAVVPNIYGQPINRARQALIAAGWRPVPGDAAGDDRFGREKELRRRGIVEVDGCSGTGFGYCSYGYEGAAGKLSVTTMGDDEFPTVSAYSTSCS